jgi:hypothetical protein
VLVTGPSGVGKSFIAAALHQCGYATYDSDAIPGLAGWHDADGHAVAWPDAPDQNFLRSHRFLWNATRLKAWLASHPVAVVFGISHNSASHEDLFDLVVLLDVSVDEILVNLAREDRDNAFGREDSHQELARRDTAEFYRRAPAHWVRLGTRDPERLIKQIEKITGQSLRLPVSDG